MYSSLNIYNQPVTLAPTTVESPNAAYQRMANFWGLVEDLKEGIYDPLRNNTLKEHFNRFLK